MIFLRDELAGKLENFTFLKLNFSETDASTGRWLRKQ